MGAWCVFKGMGILPLLWSLVAGTYTEHLEVTPLSRNEILTHFTFDMSQPVQNLNADIMQFSDFPRSLGQILNKTNTNELHLKFGQGNWNEESWGLVPQSSGGIGVELYAFVDGDYLKNWHKLVNMLGGYFCASINFINSASTTFPSNEIHPKMGGGGRNSTLLRGALPAEPICTENLTPFLKLLPCRGKAGIASLLDGHTLFAARWQSMSVDVFNNVDDGTIQLKMQIMAVHDTDKAVRELPYPEPTSELLCDKSKKWANDWTCLPLPKTNAYFNLKEIFGTEISGVCPQVTSSNTFVQVKIPDQLRQSELFDVNGNSGFDFEFALPSTNNFNLEISSPNVVNTRQTTPPILVDRSLSGYGQQSGGVRTVFENKLQVPLRVKYLDTVPWFMRLYMHTTKVKGNGKVINTKYTPSIDRSRPSTLEFDLIVGANERLQLEYKFDRSLLFIEEYPPDANHGFEVMPGLAVAFLENGERYAVRTPSLLLSLPVPDFSMPYNVIILTSTVMALAFGTIYNLVDRVVCPEDQVNKRA